MDEVDIMDFGGFMVWRLLLLELLCRLPDSVQEILLKENTGRRCIASASRVDDRNGTESFIECNRKSQPTAHSFTETVLTINAIQRTKGQSGVSLHLHNSINAEVINPPKPHNVLSCVSIILC